MAVFFYLTHSQAQEHHSRGFIRGVTEVSCYRNLNLLAHAQLEDLSIGSRCGGFGECGGDRVRVTRGAEHLTEVTFLERKHLDATLLAQGMRLACQCFPKQDDVEIHIEINQP